MRRIAFLLEYDGTRLAGSQLQPGQRTVQGELEKAIEALLGGAVRVAFAGRTDAGVHARGQVAACSGDFVHEVEAIRRAVNARLPEDVFAREAAEVEPGFDPRRNARARWYRYTILRGIERSPLYRDRAWCVRSLHRVDAVREAAGLLVGCHDFKAFAGAPVRRGASTVRHITRADVFERGNVLQVDIVGNAFLPHQVRITAGALVKVGQGKTSLAEFSRLLDQGETGSAGAAAPPGGLCLQSVTYKGLKWDVNEEEDADDVQP